MVIAREKILNGTSQLEKQLDAQAKKALRNERQSNNLVLDESYLFL